MPNTFTPPNFHEDLPSPLQTQLSTQIGARNPVGALGMLIPEMQRNAAAQDQYHDTMSQVNAMQAQNLQNNANEIRAKTTGDFLAHPIQGAGAYGILSGILPNNPAAPNFLQGLDTAAQANTVKAFGEGAGPLGQAGYQLSNPTIGHFLPTGPNGVIGNNGPAVVNAAKERGAAELGAANIRAGADKEFKVTVPTTDSVLGNAGGNAVLTGQAARDYIAQHPIGGNEHQGPTVSPAQKTAALAKLHSTDPVGYADVIKGNGKIVNDATAPGGVAFEGASGKRYH